MVYTVYYMYRKDNVQGQICKKNRNCVISKIYRSDQYIKVMEQLNKKMGYTYLIYN